MRHISGFKQKFGSMRIRCYHQWMMLCWCEMHALFFWFCV